MGQCRLYCILHGIPLPEIGSFPYKLIVEGIHRDRAEKVAFARFLARMLAPISQMSDVAADLHIIEYAEQLTQLKYNWAYESVRAKIESVREKKHRGDLDILAKVSAMTVTD